MSSTKLPSTKRLMHCSVCGQFIGIFTKNVRIEFIPDTQFTVEQTIYTHKKCLKK
jgi:hypothetical protein